ncbi:DNA polymerase iota [Aethina tumida]|uniref:DNA polymerase iota n=1 Tax=Aethina tumida TaxID=116153 RepID=UPI00096ADCE7|nr:DNA polymerase iota [Aethina tumida]
MNSLVDNISDHSRTIIHLDLDCFYAQVETIKNPKYETVPLGIQQKNIVVTSNYIAREYGIQKCMLTYEAKRLCPNLILVNGEDLHDYRQYSFQVTNILQKYSTVVERLGLDENYVDVTNLVDDKLKCSCDNIEAMGHIYGDISDLCDCGCTVRLKLGTIIAQEIRNRLKTELKLTSCAGIAHNKLLAKLVGSQHKPNQQTVIFPNSALQLMLGLSSVSCIPGIGTATAQQLNAAGIQSVEDLQNVELIRLIRLFGTEKGKALQNLSFGNDTSAVKPSGKPQSIGIEDSCKSITVEKEVKSKLQQLLHRLLILVKEDGRLPKTIKLTVRKSDNKNNFSSRETRQCNINSTLFDCKNPIKMSEENENKLLVIIMRLFSKIIDLNKSYHITLLGLSFTKFVDRPNGKNVLTKFLTKKNDIEVQFPTNLQNIQDKESSPQATPSTSSFNSDSEVDVEPSAKKHKVNLYMAKRRCHLSDESDCESPSKLRVADLRLSSTENIDTNQNVCCPPNTNEAIFRELPRHVQKELWDEYKQNRDKEADICAPLKRAKPSSILNYFVKQ